MRGVSLINLALLTALAVTATPATSKGRKTDQNDPNRVVCRNEEVIGSRLASKRTCMTAIQWQQLERDQRQTIDRVQAFKPLNDKM